MGCDDPSVSQKEYDRVFGKHSPEEIKINDYQNELTNRMVATYHRICDKGITNMYTLFWFLAQEVRQYDLENQLPVGVVDESTQKIVPKGNNH